MQTWSDGYITELPYTRSFFSELSPVHLNLICSLANVVPPQLDQGFDYCELGCGQGLTTLLLAAAFPKGRFVGVDFNPAHISQARKAAKEAGIENLTFLDASFEEIIQQKDLPGFDYITLHGIYSWISREQQQNIIRFIHGSLKAGGVVYNSYNAKPGKTGLEPVRRIFKELIPAAQNPLNRVKAGFDLLEKMAKTPRGVFSQQPDLEKRIKNLRQQSPQYVAHEFLNDHWNSYYCTDVFKDMAGAKLTYVGSANPGKNFEVLSVPAPFLEQYRAMATPEQRQLFQDLLLNTDFRKDVYVRGPIPMSRAERPRVNNSILLARSPFHQKFKEIYTCGAGQVDMTKDKDIPRVYERLSREPVPMARLLHSMPGMEPSRVMESLGHLLAGGQISAMAGCEIKIEGITRVNQLALERAADELQGTWLSSQHQGNAFFLPLIQALMLKAHLKTDTKENVPQMVAKTLAKG
ncbi:MAG: methyltransferase domain-containing protein, partial [Desulfobacteraceae bacterium]|nr:methyltransferase domain-containing protein [Desulfobacteraceae bacterium]